MDNKCMVCHSQWQDDGMGAVLCPECVTHASDGFTAFIAVEDPDPDAVSVDDTDRATIAAESVTGTGVSVWVPDVLVAYMVDNDTLESGLVFTNPAGMDALNEYLRHVADVAFEFFGTAVPSTPIPGAGRTVH